MDLIVLQMRTKDRVFSLAKIERKWALIGLDGKRRKLPFPSRRVNVPFSILCKLCECDDEHYALTLSHVPSSFGDQPAFFFS
jgi:hypothetical protein